MIDPRNTPWRQSNASVTSGTTNERRPPKSMAEIGTPAGSSHSGAMAGSCDAGAVNRAFGCAAGVPESGVQDWPFQSVRCAGGVVGHAFPPDVPVVGQRGVGEDAVAGQRQHGVEVGLVVGAGRHAEEPVLRVDGPEPAVRAELHPADVVTDRLDLPSGRVGTSMARLVLPQADGNAPVM